MIEGYCPSCDRSVYLSNEASLSCPVCASFLVPEPPGAPAGTSDTRDRLPASSDGSRRAPSRSGSARDEGVEGSADPGGRKPATGPECPRCIQLEQALASRTAISEAVRILMER